MALYMEIGRQNAKKPVCAAFTLIELILVMVIILTLLGVVFPSLKGFFRGRNLDNEARRFLSLTRYGQSRAISEGIPVELWINPRQGSYGLQALSGYSETQTNPVNFNLDQTIQISFSAPTSLLVRSNYWTQANAQFGAVTKIRFQPDGFISDTSPTKVFLRQGADSQVTIAEAQSHLRYEIQPIR
jgi:type II secretion system protein H